VELTADTLVIADHAAAVAMAGIMGGQSSAVSERTSNILLEAAFFAPDLLAGKARAYGLHTESSHRFERGVDFFDTAELYAIPPRAETFGATERIIGSCVRASAADMSVRGAYRNGWITSPVKPSMGGWELLKRSHRPFISLPTMNNRHS
jgi:hypothetical protein